jgi:homoserine kinase
MTDEFLDAAVRAAVNREMQEAVRAVQAHAEQLATQAAEYRDSVDRALFDNLSQEMRYNQARTEQQFKRMSAIGLLLTMLSGAGVAVGVAGYREARQAARFSRRAARSRGGKGVDTDRLQELSVVVASLLEETREDDET